MGNRAEWNRRYYEKNKERFLDHNRKNRAKRRVWLEQQKNKPCADCGVSHPRYVMQFDHRGEKEFNIGKLLYQVSLERLEKEVAKCDVVCANCHAERTHSRS